MKITSVRTVDVRFPTSLLAHGSDAMHQDPDYSAAYVVLETEHGPHGHGLSFTLGRGNDIVTTAIDSLGSLLIGRDARELFADMGAASGLLTHDSQFRWLGPEKGVVHLAAGAILNALWDLYAKVERKPLWLLLAELTPQQLVSTVDWRHLADALGPEEALEILERLAPTKSKRIKELLREGYPAYTTSVGWYGLSDEVMVELSRQAVADGFTQVKVKVGADLERDLHRVALVRQAVGPDVKIAIDANQVWEVHEAIAAVEQLKQFDLSWVEEPVSPDDILGQAVVARAIAPIRVASGEHVHNRIMFKQFLQAGAMGVCQIDACRVGGVNENIAILLLAAKFGVPVCPHAGGVGLCEMVQHLAMFDFVAVSGTMDERYIEYVDHLHEHFVVPAVVVAGRYQAPRQPGFGAQMHPQSLVDYRYPTGSVWRPKTVEGVA